MNVIVRAIKAAVGAAVVEITTPESYRKGDEFVAYVRSTLFPKDKYRLLQKTHDYASNKHDYIESTKEPDLKLQSLTTGEVFFVEAKYRSKSYSGTIDWCKDYQFTRYREIDSTIPVYVALGVGEQPSHLGEVYLIPISHIKYRKLYRSFLKRYGIDPNHYVDYKSLSAQLNKSNNLYQYRPSSRLLTIR